MQALRNRGNTESPGVASSSFADLLKESLFEEMKPLIDEYIEAKLDQLVHKGWPEYIQRRDIEQYVGCSKSTFDRWVKDGLPVIKNEGPNGQVMVRSSDLRMWLDRKEK
ncbi:helix-turn-helix transcriptional regulator [Peptococcus simiae]|uniref:helix-turn-helix transcriptional regulator n=1 Tax=Peptococcus simiae TaxID=1643805 RepID=UPI00398004CE